MIAQVSMRFCRAFVFFEQSNNGNGKILTFLGLINMFCFKDHVFEFVHIHHWMLGSYTLQKLHFDVEISFNYIINIFILISFKIGQNFFNVCL